MENIYNLNISKKSSAIKLDTIINKRNHYINFNNNKAKSNSINYSNGIFIVDKNFISINEYYNDLELIHKYTEDDSLRSFSHDRFKLLLLNWEIYKSNNKQKEFEERMTLEKDFYNIPKVDTHIHHSSSMNQKFLLNFVKNKIINSPDEVVLEKNGKKLTLINILKDINITPDKLNVDIMNVHAVGERHCFMRFDKFNSKYNPCGLSDLRNVFLKTDNYINGRYLAEMTRSMIEDLEKNKYQYVEWRLSIYGKDINEWNKLADWVCNNNLLSKKVKYFIQIPRLYNIYKENKFVDNFSDMIYNIFYPVLNNTINPASNLNLSKFLENIGGFDSVDDETKYDVDINKNEIPTPNEWNMNVNPPYSYYLYYMYVNICSLNKLRSLNNINLMEFRPHCGEGGSKNHILSGFLLSTKGISHGVKIFKNPTYKYLFYLTQIGISMSLLSNNALVVKYGENPFPIMFKAGLNVSLSTDDPLMFHYTREPLMEEYSMAAQFYNLSNTDMCELAKNSVEQSCMYEKIKKDHYDNINDDLKNNNLTNIPKNRIEFRKSLLENEKNFLTKLIKLK